MAYFHDAEWYVYGNSEAVSFTDHEEGVSIVMPLDRVDAFALMHVAKLIADGRLNDTIGTVVGLGTLGADAIRQLVGLPTTIDQLREQLAERGSTSS